MPTEDDSQGLIINLYKKNDALQTTVNDLTKELNDLKKEFTEKETELKNQKDLLESSLKHSGAGSSAVIGADVIEELSAKIDDVTRKEEFYRSEIQKLSDDNEGLRAALAHTEEKLMNTSEAFESMRNDLAFSTDTVEKLRDELKITTVEKNELEVLLKNCQVEKSRLEVALDAAQTEVAKRNQELYLKTEEFKRLLEESVKAKEALQLVVQQRDAEIRAIKDQSRVSELESKIAMLNNEVSTLAMNRDAIQDELAKTNQELDLALEMNEVLKANRDQELAEAVISEKSKVDLGINTLKSMKIALEKEREEKAALNARFVVLEDELSSANKRIKQFEESFGIDDVFREQRELRAAVRSRDNDIARLTAESGQRGDMVGVLQQIITRLLEESGRAGVDPFTLYDELSIRKDIETTASRLRSLNRELKAQNELLEEERMRLLKQQRIHAENIGRDSMKYFGLTGEQMMLVNEFADKLRDGKIELPESQSVLDLKEKLREATEANNVLKDLLSNRAPAPATFSTDSDVTKLQSQLDDLRRKNTEYRDELERLRRSASTGKQQLERPLVPSTESSPPNETLSKILRELERLKSPSLIHSSASVDPAVSSTLRDISDQIRSLMAAPPTAVRPVESVTAGGVGVSYDVPERTLLISRSAEEATMALLAAVNAQMQLLSASSGSASLLDTASGPGLNVPGLEACSRLLNNCPVSVLRTCVLSLAEQCARTQAADDAAQLRMRAAEARTEAAETEAATATAAQAQAEGSLEALRAELARLRQLLAEAVDLSSQLSSLTASPLALPVAGDVKQAEFSPSSAEIEKTLRVLQGRLAEISVRSSVGTSTNARSEADALEIALPFEQLKSTLEELTSTASSSLSSSNAVGPVAYPAPPITPTAGDKNERESAEQMSLRDQLAVVRSENDLLRSLLLTVQGHDAKDIQQILTELSQSTVAPNTLVVADSSETEHSISGDAEDPYVDRLLALVSDRLTHHERVLWRKVLSIGHTRASRLEKRLAAASITAAASAGVLSELRKELATLRRANVDIVRSSSSTSLGSTAATSSKALDALTDQLMEARRQADRRLSEVERLRAEATSLRSALTDARAAAAAATASLQEARLARDGLEFELKHLSSDKSSATEVAGTEESKEKGRLNVPPAIRVAVLEGALAVARADADAARVSMHRAILELEELKTSVESTTVVPESTIADSASSFEVSGSKEISDRQRLQAACARVVLLEGLLDDVLAVAEESPLTHLQITELMQGVPGYEFFSDSTDSIERASGVSRSVSELQSLLSANRRRSDELEAKLVASASVIAGLRTHVRTLSKDMLSIASKPTPAPSSSSPAQLDEIVRKLTERAVWAREAAGRQLQRLATAELAASAADARAARLGKALAQSEQRLRSLEQSGSSTDSSSLSAAEAIRENEYLRSELARARADRDIARARALAAQDLVTNKLPTHTDSATLPNQSYAATVNPLDHPLGTPAASTTVVSQAGRNILNRFRSLGLLGGAEDAAGPGLDLGSAHVRQQVLESIVDSRAALVEALEELALTQRDREQLQALVSASAAQLSRLQAQQTALYREFVAGRLGWDAEARRLRSAKKQAEERAAIEEGRMAKLLELLGKGSTINFDGEKIPDYNVDEVMHRAASGVLDIPGVSPAALALLARLPHALPSDSGATNDDKTAYSELRACLGATARRLATLEAALPLVARKAAILRQESASARAAARAVNLNAVEAEAHARHRILYLELYKRGAESRLMRLQAFLDSCVPAPVHVHVQARRRQAEQELAQALQGEARAVSELARVADAPRRLADAERALADAHDSARRAESELLTLRQDNQALRVQLAELLSPGESMRQSSGSGNGGLQAHLSSALLASARVNRQAPHSTVTDKADQGMEDDGTEVLLSLGTVSAALGAATRSELTTLVVTLRGLAARLKHENAAVSSQLRTAHAHARTLSEESERLQSRAEFAESALARLRQAASLRDGSPASAGDSALLCQHCYSSTNVKKYQNLGAIAAAFTSENKQDTRIPALSPEQQMDLEQKVAHLESELYKARSIADIAGDQVQQLTMLMKSEENERSDLREALLTLASRSDGDATIGRLQHTVLALKGSHQAAARRQDALAAQLARARTAATALEQVLDQRRGELLVASEDAHVRFAALERLFENAMDRLRIMEASGDTLSGLREHRATVQRLAGQCASLRAETKAAAAAEREAQALRERAEVKNEVISKELDHLRELVVAQGTPGSGGGSDRVTLLIQTIQGLHADLEAVRRDELTHRREAMRNKEELVAEKERLRQSTSKCFELEDLVLGLETKIRGLEVRLMAAELPREHTSPVDSKSKDSVDNNNKQLVVRSAAVEEEELGELRRRIAELTAAETAAVEKLRLAEEQTAAAMRRARLRTQRYLFLLQQLELSGADRAALEASVAAAVGPESESDRRLLQGHPLATEEPDADSAEGELKKRIAADAVVAVDLAGAVGGTAAAVQRTREHYEAELQRLTQSSNASIASLKKLLQEKSETVNRYMRALDALRQERAADLQRLEQERLRFAAARSSPEPLTGLIESIKHAHENDAVSDAATKGTLLVNAELVDRTRQLDAAVANRDTQIVALQAQLSAAEARERRAVDRNAELDRVVAEASANLAAEKARCETRVAEIRADCESSINRLNATVASLRLEIVEVEKRHAAEEANLRKLIRVNPTPNNATSISTTQEKEKEKEKSSVRAATAVESDIKSEDVPPPPPAAPAPAVTVSVQEFETLKLKYGVVVSRLAELQREVHRMKESSAPSSLNNSFSSDIAKSKEKDKEKDPPRLPVNPAEAEALSRLRSQLSEAREKVNSLTRQAGLLETENRRLRAEHTSLQEEHAAQVAAHAEALRDAVSRANERAAETYQRLLDDSEERCRQLRMELAAAGDGSSEVFAKLMQDHAALQRKHAVMLAQQEALVAAGVPGGVVPVDSLVSPGSNSGSNLHSNANSGSNTNLGSNNAGLGSNNTISSGNNAGGDLGGRSAELRMALEEQRKLRKRADAASKRAQDATSQLEAERSQLSAAQAALARARTEATALEKANAQLTRKLKQLEGAAAATLSEIEPVMVLRTQICELEDTVAALRLEIGGPLATKARALEQRAQEAEARSATAEKDRSELAARLQQQEAALGHILSRLSQLNSGQPNPPSASAVAAAVQSVLSGVGLRVEEGVFATEAMLRARVTDLRAQLAASDSRASAAEQRALELSFELESARLDRQRISRRVSELQAFAVIAARGQSEAEVLNSVAITGGAATAAPKGAPRHSSKREAELEDAITALKRVTEKQKAEIERLRHNAYRNSSNAYGSNSAPPSSSATSGGGIVAALPSTTSTSIGSAESMKLEDKEYKLTAAAAKAASAAKLAEDYRTAAISAQARESNMEIQLRERTQTLARVEAEKESLKERLTALRAQAPDSARALDQLRAQLSSARADAVQARERANTLDSHVLTLVSRSALLEENFNGAIACARAQQQEVQQTRLLLAALARRMRANGTEVPDLPALDAEPTPIFTPKPIPALPFSLISSLSGVNVPGVDALIAASRREEEASKTSEGESAPQSSVLTALAAVSRLAGAVKRSESLKNTLEDSTNTSSATGLEITPIDSIINDKASLKREYTRLQERLVSLEKENSELKTELGAFDLEFFDEIEDLKFKYAEASAKCKAFDEYVKMYPPTIPE